MTTNSGSNIPTGASGTILTGGGVGSNSVFTTATYPATTTVSQLLYSSSANVVAGLATANRAVVTTNATGVPVVTALATDGQLIIGSTAGAPAAATLTAGAGVTITNGSNSITVATSAVGTTWTDQTTTTVTMTANNGYIADNAGLVTLTIPATAALGAEFTIAGKGAGGWLLQANTGQTIHLGSSATSSAGSLASTNQWDGVKIVCVTANTIFAVVSAVGNLTVV